MPDELDVPEVPEIQAKSDGLKDPAQKKAEHNARVSSMDRKKKIRAECDRKMMTPEEIDEAKKRLAETHPSRVDEILVTLHEGYLHECCAFFRSALEGKAEYRKQPIPKAIADAAAAMNAEVPSEEVQRKAARDILWRENVRAKRAEEKGVPAEVPHAG